MRTRIFKMGLLAIAFSLSMMVTGTSFAAELKRFTIGCGPVGGPARVYCGPAVTLFNDTFKDKYFLTHADTSGGVETLRRMYAKEFDTGIVHTNTSHDAWNGVGFFEGQKPFKELRLIAKVIDQAVCVATLAKLPIRKFMDMQGKRLAIGTPGSIGVSISRDIIKTFGLNVKQLNVGYEAASQGLKDGQIDVSMGPGGPYVPPAILEISRSTTIRLVEPAPEEISMVEKNIPYLHLGAIPPNKAPGENADKERKAFFFAIWWVARAEMPDEAIYDMLKVTLEPKNKEMLGKVSSYWLTTGPDFGAMAKVGIPIHPGAVKYWKEQGAKLPSELVK